MKITKFPQSCILIESNGIKILVDPGTTKYEKKFLENWKRVDAVLITHRHGDHLHKQVLEEFDVPIYSTHEVANFAPNLKINIIKENDIFSIKDIKIEVVKAVHGFVGIAGQIFENVGFVIDDGKTRLYVTSDTICYNHNFKANIIFADITSFDASMNLWGAVETMKEVGAELMIVAHQDGGKTMYKKEEIENYLKEQNVNYIFPEIMQSFEI